MKRLFVVYNPRSSRYADVRNEVLDKIKQLSGYLVGKYEVEKIGVDKNAEKLAKIINDDDLILAVGGDATAVIAVNAIMISGKDAGLAVLPYGNFNDLARTLGTKTFEDIFEINNQIGAGPSSGSRDVRVSGGSYRKLYPLEIIVDGKRWRYATCYVTIGMMADAVKLYDTPKVRKILKSKIGRMIGSYTELVKWYFKNRRKKVFIPEFKLNGVLQDRRVSDYAAVNGRSMARVMKGGDDYQKPKVFRSETDRLTNFWRLIKLMIKSILVRVPGAETRGDVLEFVNPATVEIQAEGEYLVFKDIKKIEIRKAEKCLKVIES